MSITKSYSGLLSGQSRGDRDNLFNMPRYFNIKIGYIEIVLATPVIIGRVC